MPPTARKRTMRYRSAMRSPSWKVVVLSPGGAPSRGTVGWLETSVRFPLPILRGDYRRSVGVVVPILTLEVRVRVGMVVVAAGVVRVQVRVRVIAVGRLARRPRSVGGRRLRGAGRHEQE